MQKPGLVTSRCGLADKSRITRPLSSSGGNRTRSYDRTSINSWEDVEFKEAVKAPAARSSS